MTDDIRLQPLGKFRKEGVLPSGYGDHVLFLVGRDDVHGILHYLLTNELSAFEGNMYGYDDPDLNDDIMNLIKDSSIAVQLTLDKSQAGGVAEKKLLALDESRDPTGFNNSVAIGESATHQISHTKGGICVGQGIWFEGSTNWSKAGEGVGISLKQGEKNAPGFKAQNNTLLVSCNSANLNIFRTQLAMEHRIALRQGGNHGN